MKKKTFKVCVEHTFVSRKSGAKIKVTKVKRLGSVRRYDLCRVLTVDSETGKVDRKSGRLVQADSIRRKYVKV